MCIRDRPGDHHGRIVAGGLQHFRQDRPGDKPHMRILSYNFRFLKLFLAASPLLRWSNDLRNLNYHFRFLKSGPIASTDKIDEKTRRMRRWNTETGEFARPDRPAHCDRSHGTWRHTGNPAHGPLPVLLQISCAAGRRLWKIIPKAGRVRQFDFPRRLGNRAQFRDRLTAPFDQR